MVGIMTNIGFQRGDASLSMLEAAIGANNAYNQYVTSYRGWRNEVSYTTDREKFDI